MNRWLPLMLVVSMAIAVLFTVGPVRAEDTKSEGAWCGGSWSPGAVDEGGKIVDRGGVSFAKCVPMVKKVAGKDVSVATHPAHPARQIVMQRDAKGNWVGGTMQSEKSPDGKTSQKFVAIPRRVLPKKR